MPFNSYCVVWPDCDSGWATIEGTYVEAGDVYVVSDVTCLSEAACQPSTPVPNASPTPGDFWPCDIPPTIDNGFIRQPCDDWPGFYIDVSASIPPAAVLRNPWTRGMVGVPNCFWYQGANDLEKWSEEKALPCSGIDYGARYNSRRYNCGGETGRVTEGAKVNYQIGVAWRHWDQSDGPILGHTPVDEVAWVIKDREWNGGTQMRTGYEMCYTFETSSFGLGEDGPVWNPECQDRECTCDERVLSWLGEESYHVNVETWWWPEYSMRYDEYYCTDRETYCEHRPGWGTAGCDDNGDGINDPDTVERSVCKEWGWRNVQDAWEIYDLTQMGMGSPLVGSTAVVVAGADSDGVRCSEYTDAWPCYIPVPVLELQPVGPGWYE